MNVSKKKISSSSSLYCIWLASLVSHHLFIMGFANKDCYLYPFEANKLVTISSCNKFMFSSSIISKCRNLFLFPLYYFPTIAPVFILMVAYRSIMLWHVKYPNKLYVELY
jgi:hypothetical protein